MSDLWYCEVCDKTLKRTSKYAHVKSQNHNRKLQQHEDCLICCTDSVIFNTCKNCDQKWCMDCDHKIGECPFCRASLNRPQKLETLRRENTNWQLNQDAFIPNNDELRLLVRLIFALR